MGESQAMRSSGRGRGCVHDMRKAALLHMPIAPLSKRDGVAPTVGNQRFVRGKSRRSPALTLAGEARETSHGGLRERRTPEQRRCIEACPSSAKKRPAGWRVFLGTKF